MINWMKIARELRVSEAGLRALMKADATEHKMIPRGIVCYPLHRRGVVDMLLPSCGFKLNVKGAMLVKQAKEMAGI